MTGVEDGVPRCPVCRYRELSGPLYLCAACLEHLGADLDEVVRLAARLDARPAIAGLDGRGPPGFRSKPPGRVDVWVARDERSKPYPVTEEWHGRDRDGVEDALPSYEDDRPIRGVAWTLSSWAGLIHESRGFSTALPGTVAELAEWIYRQSDYVSRWPDDGPELARDVRLLRNQLRSLTGDPNPKPAAWCIRLVPLEDGSQATCSAAIFLPRGQTEIDHTQPLKLWCCAPEPHVYSGMDLLKLKLANEGDACT